MFIGNFLLIKTASAPGNQNAAEELSKVQEGKEQPLAETKEEKQNNDNNTSVEESSEGELPVDTSKSNSTEEGEKDE